MKIPMKQGFVNQKLGKRNNRRNALLKAKAHGQPSLSKSQASKPLEGRGNRRAL
ncbi:MAG: hypothetical protein WAN10_16930 [Candidatus Acidiferrales bacterium]